MAAQYRSCSSAGIPLVVGEGARQVRQNGLLDCWRLAPEARHPACPLSLDGLPVAKCFPQVPRVMEKGWHEVEPDGFLTPARVRSPAKHLLSPPGKQFIVRCVAVTRNHHRARQSPKG